MNSPVDRIKALQQRHLHEKQEAINKIEQERKKVFKELLEESPETIEFLKLIKEFFGKNKAIEIEVNGIFYRNGEFDKDK